MPKSKRKDTEPELSRDEILSILGKTMRNLEDQIQSKDIDPADPDLHLRRIRTLGYLTDQYRKILNDQDLDKMQEDLALLKGDTGT